ncbi:MAG: Crp/Fnr family transcriptional regulator [bacterium]|nr:Crp/Fnr family transcriptional regulator [bacterium]
MADALSAADRVAFAALVRRVVPFEDSAAAPILDAARTQRLTGGELFLNAGDRATKAGTVVTGVMREYYPLADGREVTRNFAGPGDGIGSLSDLISGEASKSAIAAETDARIVTVPWHVLRGEADRNQAVATFLARTTEQLYLLKARREYELLALDAEARYLAFRARFAELEDQIQLKQVASYVGITPEHLSRLRRRLAGAPRE